MHDVPFNVEPFEGIQSNGKESEPKTCPIPIQKETPAGLIDTLCNVDVAENQAGLCK